MFQVKNIKSESVSLHRQMRPQDHPDCIATYDRRLEKASDFSTIQLGTIDAVESASMA
jgi:hypothetical protein